MLPGGGARDSRFGFLELAWSVQPGQECRALKSGHRLHLREVRQLCSTRATRTMPGTPRNAEQSGLSKEILNLTEQSSGAIWLRDMTPV
ncbi:hypothetical protein AAFF_G00230400 [Aldrovandia affinis]|uniref:Uncharacterized protein n=1 Tax=Aldrovandia affinis TaxID=143900 RepID=A0AAD7RFK6_9TELE|nr:hypothetical protein AAFF_G00230400 [Aldrovandia affinis]